MIKFLPGILLSQLAMSGLMIMAINWSNDFQLIFVIVVIALMMSVLLAFWFASIARNISIEEQALIVERHVQDRENILKKAESEKIDVLKEKSELQDQYAREREQILINAEKEKASVVEKSYQKIEKETRRANARANLKVGLAFTVTVAAAGVMIVSQLVTIGVMFLVASGSGLSGYVLRARHEQLARKNQLALTQDK